MTAFRVQFYVNALCTEYLQVEDMREAVRLLQNNYLEGIPFGEYDHLDGYDIQVRSIDLYEGIPSISGKGSDMEEQFKKTNEPIDEPYCTGCDENYTNYHAPEGAMYVEEIE